MSLARAIRHYKRVSTFLRHTGAPKEVRRLFRRDWYRWYAERHERRRYVGEWATRIDRGAQFSTHWLDGHLYNQEQAFLESGKANSMHDILEIGSYEGRSTKYLLMRFPEAQLTAVDTWEGSEEHGGDESLSCLEAVFDANVSQFKDRLHKRKGRSIEFFASDQPEGRYDLCYVDGSHFGDDVLVDAVESFRRTKQGGIIVFDDYTWNYHSRPSDNVALPLNSFLRVKSGQYRVLSVTDQLIIQKLSPS